MCCPAVSYSRFACNSNISAIMPGPIGQYTFKYNVKDTQKDDVAPYTHVAEATCRALNAVRSHESDRSESIRRLLTASHAHQKKNVLHGTMASYLVWNKKRFIFSHDTVWCPMRDLESLLKGGKVFTTITHHGKTPFYQTATLHYLCRPIELESISVHDFYSQYEVVKVTACNADKVL